MNTNQLRKEIEQKKRKLIAVAKTKGLYENFGQDAVQELNDKYWNTFQNLEVSILLAGFDDWCQNYTGEIGDR